jgi:hypothetical protein
MPLKSIFSASKIGITAALLVRHNEFVAGRADTYVNSRKNPKKKTHSAAICAKLTHSMAVTAGGFNIR